MDVETKEKTLGPISPIRFREESYRERDEFTFVDLCALAVRRRKLVLAVFLVTTLGAGFLAWLSPPVYESRAVLLVGQLVHLGQLRSASSPPESTEDLVERLKEEYKLNDVNGEEREFPLVNSIKINRGAKNLITITAHGSSATDARDFLVAVTNKILTDHNIRRNRVRDLIEERMDSVQSRLNDIDSQIKILNGQIASINKTNSTAAGILTMEQSVLFQHVAALEKQRAEWAMDLTGLDMRPTQLVRVPTLLTTPVMPKPGLYVFLGAILGIVFGVLISFLAESRSASGIRHLSA